MPSSYTFSDPRLAKLDGFRVEIDERMSVPTSYSAAAPINRGDAAARSASADLRDARRDPRVRIIVVRSDGRALLQRRQHRGFHGGNARTCLEARLEYRSARALRQASDRRQPWLLFRRRLRDLARLRFPDCVGDHAVRAAGAEARSDPGIGWFGAAAEDGRHHPHKGYRHAFQAHPAKQALEWGIATECVPDSDLERSDGQRWWTSFAPSRRWRSGRRRSS